MVFMLENASVTTKETVGTSASRVNLTGVQPQGRSPQVRIMCKNYDTVFKFGDSNVTASNTYSGDDLTAGNHVILAGAIEVFRIPPDATHMSVICEDGVSTTGVVFVTPGTGEV